MRLLLDTHAFLWFIAGDPRMSGTARSLIEAVENEKLVSLASAWEIAIKGNTGKLTLAEPFDVLIPREIQDNGFQILPIEFDHTAVIATLPLHHRDPFDRMLVAQAMVEQIPVLSDDSAFDAYPVTRLW